MDRITELEVENRVLKTEIECLKMELMFLKENDWKHPDSCLHNCDPWATWLSKK